MRSCGQPFRLLALMMLCLVVPTAWSAVDHFTIYATGGSGTDPVADQTAGQSFTIRIVAYSDAAETTITNGFNGTVTLTSNATITSGATTGSFSNGVRTSHSITLATANTNRTITVSGSPTGTSNTFTVAPGAATRFIISGTGTQGAGDAQTLTLTAYDAQGNVATGYTGTKTVTFSGATASASGDAPTATDDSAAAVAFGSGTSMTFAAGVATTSLVLYRDENASLTASATGVTTPTPLAVDVSPAAAMTFTLTGTATQTAGVGQTVTVSAFDTYGNQATGYTGSQSVTFTGATASPDNDDPTATNSSSTAIDFGSATSLTFAGGAATTSVVLYKVENAALAASATGVTTPTPLAVAVSPAAAATFTLSGTAAQTAGTAQTVTLMAFDAFGNPATGYTGAKTITFSGAADSLLGDDATATNSSSTAIAFGSSTSLTFATGTATTSVVLYRDENALISATATGVTTPSPLAVDVAPAVAATLGVSGFSDPTVAGVAHNVTVTARDSFGNTATGYAGTVAITSSDTAAVLPANATLTAGTGTFSVALKTAGTARTITATDTVTATITGIQSAIDVNPAAASKLAIQQIPTSAVADTLFSPQPVIHIQDAFGNLVDDDTTVVTAALTTGTGGQFKGDNTITASNGVATFTDLHHDKKETIVIEFTGASLVPISTPSIPVGSGVAATLQVSGFPSPQTAGTASSLTVTALDSVGNVADGYTGTVHFTSTDAQAVLPANYTFVAGDNGVHIFSSVELRTAGTRTITATDTVTGTITGIQSAITVNPATAVQLVFTTQPGSATAGANFATQPVVRTRDAYGNNSTVGLAASVPVTMTLSSGSGSLAGATVINVGSSGTPGVATYTDLRIDDASGSKTLTASATLNSVSVAVPANPFPVAPDVAQQLAIQVQPPTSVTAGVTFTPSPVVRILDQFGNLRSSDTLTVTVARDGGSGTLQGATSVSAVAGVATFNALSHPVANDITLRFTSGALQAATSNTVSVVAGAASALRITGGATQVAGTVNVITIAAIDSLGNQVNGYSGAKTLTFGGASFSINPVTAPTVEDSSALAVAFTQSTSLTFTSGAVTTNMRLYRSGNPTVTVTDGTLSASGGNALGVMVGAAAATRLVLTGPANLTAGATGDLTITATDPYGNTDATYTGSHSLIFGGAGSSTDPVTIPTVENSTGTQIAFGTATPLSFTAGVSSVGGGVNGQIRLFQMDSPFITATDGTISAAGSDRLQITVAHAVANKLVVTGAASQLAGQVQDIVVTVQDQYGNTATSQAGAVDVTFAGTGTGAGFNQAGNQPRVSRRTTGAEIDFGSATSLQFLAGVASTSNDALQCHLRLVKVGTASITATASGLAASTPLVVTVSAGAASRLAITGVGSTMPIAGQGTTIDVVLWDDGGNVVTGSTAIDLTLSATPTASSLQAGYAGAQIAAGASGTTITGVTLNHAEAGVVLQVDDTPDLYVAATGPTMAVQNDRPVLSIASGTLTYSGGNGAIPFGTPGISVSDVNSFGFAPNYTGAVISAAIDAVGRVPTEDLLQVRTAGSISVSGTTVSYNGTAIASVSGGFGTTALTVTITGTDVSASAVNALLENLCFHNIGGANPTQGVRTVTLDFNDGSSSAPGGALAALQVTRSIQVVAGNALPVIEANVELSVVRSSTTIITNTSLRVSDDESLADQLEFTVIDFPTEGDLLLNGVALASGGTDTFTQDDIDNNRLSYHHRGSSLPGDVFTFIVTDGTNPLPVTTFSITVPGADANPVLFLPISTLTYTEGSPASVVFPNAPFSSGTLVSDANTFEYSNGSLLVEIVDADGNPDVDAGDRLTVRSQSIPGLAQYSASNPYYTPEIDYAGHIAMVGTDVVRRQYSFYYYWGNDYYNTYVAPGMFPDPGLLPFPSPETAGIYTYPNSWYFGYPVPIDVRIASRDNTLTGVGGPLCFMLLNGVGAGFGDPIVSAQAVAHLIDNLSFANVSDNPPARDRWLRITLAEGAPSTAVGVASIKLTITPVNDAPVFEIPAPPPAPVDVIEALAGVTLRVRVLATDPDLPSTSSLTYSLTQVDPPSAGVATINATSGALDFTPLSTFVGPVTLFVRATDNLGAIADAEVEVDVVAGPTDLGPLVVSDPPFETFAGVALSHPLVIRPDPALPAPGAGTVTVTLVGDVPTGAVISPGSDQLHPVLEAPSVVRPPDGVYTFGIRVEIDYGGTRRVGYQPVTYKVRAIGAPN